MPSPLSPSRPLIFQCPLCKDLVPLQQFSTSPKGITLHCPSCEGSFFLSSPLEPSLTSGGTSAKASSSASLSAPSPAPVSSTISKLLPTGEIELVSSPLSSPSSPTSAPSRLPLNPNADLSNQGLSCPKCKTPRAEASLACWRCGLDFSNVGTTFQPEDLDTPTTPEGEEALRLWKEVLQRWDDPAPHETFLLYCSNKEMFEHAALRYRMEKEKRGDTDTIAAVRLQRIVELVQSQFLAKPEEKEKTHFFLQVFFVLLLGAVSVFFFYSILRSWFPKP